ncbi:MAG: hypothetical protein QXJ17_04220 [Nitrososphaeria archaeon]
MALIVVIAMFTITFEVYALVIYPSTHVHTPMFEAFSIKSAYAESPTKVILNVGNSGTYDTNITRITINGQSLNTFNCSSIAPNLPIGIKKGQTISVTLSFTTPLKSGETYSVWIYGKWGGDAGGNFKVP